MAVKVRLARIGTKHVPHYRIVAVDGRNKRDGAYLENLGTYDALNSSVITIHMDQIDKWVANGAILSDTVKKIYKMHKKASSAPASVKKVAAPKKSAAKPVVQEETSAEARAE